MARIKIVCSTCGSEDVRRDAMAAWNVVRQEWELAAVMDQGYCEGKCEGECSLDEIEVPLLIKLAYKVDELLTLNAHDIDKILPDANGSLIVMKDGTEHRTFNQPDTVQMLIDSEKSTMELKEQYSAVLDDVIKAKDQEIKRLEAEIVEKNLLRLWSQVASTPALHSHE